MSTEMDLTDDVETYDETVEEDETYGQYKSVSKAAMSSLFLTLLSLSGLMFPVLLVLAVLGAVLGIVAIRHLRRYPDELTGWIPATLGTVGCVLLFIGGSAMHTYVYMTEVPPGYHRISFADLQPKGLAVETGLPRLPTELDGQRVFVKGYVHPGVSELGQIKKFVLVPDMGTCCFGGQPKNLADMIEVTIVGPPGVQYSQRKRKLGGILRVTGQVKRVAGGLTGGYYELTADYVR